MFSNIQWRRVAVGALALVVVVGLVVVLVGPDKVGRLLQTRAASLYSFYQPSTNVTAAQAAARNDFIVLTQNRGYRDTMRTNGFQGPILEYVLFTEADGPAPLPTACDVN